MADSAQHKIGRVRAPRVQITYDVEVGNAIEMKELPFVLGIMADLSGMPAVALPKLKDRKFIEIDRDNIDGIMAFFNPRLVLGVPNTLIGDGAGTEVELTFSSMDDFTPLNIVKQIPDLAKLYESRSRLKDLLTKLDGNDELEEELVKIMTDEATKDAMKGLLPQAGTGEAAEESAAEAEAEPEADAAAATE
ncbi:MAG: type VI secretion system contractile sheath small subunit [Holosporales bacterium]|jgi:type VI secretion system protein ImpB|nr:type VI secretion system contractile sheath small subunit [Holosporales bacterium]